MQEMLVAFDWLMMIERGIPKQPKSQTAENEKPVSNSRIFVYAAI